jgi:hypothetical protein
MISSKKTLLLGLALGTIGFSLYNLIKDQKKTYIHIKKNTLAQPVNITNSSETSTINSNLKDSFNELKRQTNLLEEKLSEFED